MWSLPGNCSFMKATRAFCSSSVNWGFGLKPTGRGERVKSQTKEERKILTKMEREKG